jgi:quercetin dioxygenase-like cupin family protein
MNTAEFERSLRADGYQQIETKSVSPRTHNDAHEHPFDVKALVLDGQIALMVANESRTYRVGEVFTMAAGCKHVEDIGAEGVRYIVGRRSAP